MPVDEKINLSKVRIENAELFYNEIKEYLSKLVAE